MAGATSPPPPASHGSAARAGFNSLPLATSKATEYHAAWLSIWVSLSALDEGLGERAELWWGAAGAERHTRELGPWAGLSPGTPCLAPGTLGSAVRAGMAADRVQHAPGSRLTRASGMGSPSPRAAAVLA